MDETPLAVQPGAAEKRPFSPVALGIPSCAKYLNLAAIGALVALIILGLAWELRLAPLRPNGSWLALKVLPLLAPLLGLLHARRYTHQWTTLLALAYFMEGVVRATSEYGTTKTLATVELLLALVLFLCTALFARLTKP